MSRRRGGRGRWLPVGVLTVVVAAGGAWTLAAGDDRGPASQPLVTARAVRTTLTQTIDASFTLAKEGARRLLAPTGGTVTGMALTEGAAVPALTALASVDGKAVYGIPSAYPFHRDLAAGDEGEDVRALQKALAAAGYDPGGVDGSFGDGTADALAAWQTDRDLDATGRLDLTRFVSYPPGSVVDEVAVEIGDRVAPGGQLATLSPKHGLVARADVSQLDVDRLKVGQDVTLTFDGLSGAAAKGKVEEIARAAEPSDSSAGSSPVVQYPVTVRVSRLPAGARAGMTGQASVVTASRRNVVVVPSTAVGGTAASPTVGVVEDGATVTRPVVVGLVTSQGTEILAGVRAGEQVVTGVAATDTGPSDPNGPDGGPPGGFRIDGVPGGFGGGGNR